MKIFAAVLLILALCLEISVTTLPLVFVSLLCLIVVLREDWLFIAAFLTGLLLDLLSFRTLGLSSIFLVSFLFVVLLYQGKFEIDTGYFVAAVGFLGSFLFLFLVGSTQLIIVQAIFSSLIAWLLFKLIKFSQFKTQHG